MRHRPRASVACKLTLDQQAHLKEFKSEFENEGYIVRAQDGQLLAMASMEANLYQMEMKKVNETNLDTLAYTLAHAHMIEL